MLIFAFSIFLSAFLLFTIQPLIAKKLLPWFGSSPTVWLSNILFFQVTLVLGYTYAYLLAKIRKVSCQVFIHVFLLLCSLLFLPISPAIALSSLPVWPPLVIFAVLTATLFLPSILISASSPLFQYWYCQCYRTDFPYRYYALSNAGSLLGLLSFPLLFEPWLGLHAQLFYWSFFYAIFLISTLMCLTIYWKNQHTHYLTNTSAPAAPLAKLTLMHWVLLTLFSSALLLSSTQAMMQNVASFPLLWVVPLALYLLSFIVTFSFPAVYYRPFWMIGYTIFCAIIFHHSSHHQLTLKLQFLVYFSMLFFGCMVCHGELIRLKPNKQHLTIYYLAIAAGGVIGGILINILAPILFNECWEFYFSSIGLFLYAGYLSFYRENKPFSGYQLTLEIGWFAGFVGLTSLLYYHLYHTHKDLIFTGRNFLGVLTIEQKNTYLMENRYRTLCNGNIIHGQQFLDPKKRMIATSYYSLQSGIGLAIDYQRFLKSEGYFKGLRIGVIGLGTGTIAALCLKNDLIRFYEIDPDIQNIAKKYFYYLDDSPAIIDVVINDGRIALSERLQQKKLENYDVIAIDAFNGDAIPIHLLTLEAFQIYLAHLAPKGILAFHISSRYVDLFPPLQAISGELGLFAYSAYNEKDENNWGSSSEWVLITRDPIFGSFLYQRNALEFRPQRIATVWTDDFNYLLSVIKW